MNDRTLLKSLLAGLSLLLALAAQADTQMLDRVVAIVDDDIVLASELNERLDQVRANVARSGQEIPEEVLRREVLDLMILESIQMQMAERVGLRIGDEQLNAAMARIAEQNGMSLVDFQRALDASGGSYRDARQQVEREMILQQVQRGNVSQRVGITDQEIENYLQSDEGSKRTAPEFHFAHVLVPVASDADEAARARARKAAENIAAKLQQNDDYQAVAKAASANASDLGWRKQADVPSLFAETAAGMRDGQVSPVIESASGYHVIKLLESRGLHEVVAQTRASHVLLKPSAIRNEQQTEALAKELRRRAQSGESFRDLARAYSEDIGSAQEGGELGWTNPGQLVPEFQQAMDITDIGSISQPFKSRYGWHIVKVEDRRQQDVTDTLRRNLARNMLFERKYKEELDIWLRKIRDEAYVDIK